MNAPLRPTEETWRVSDRHFLAQLRAATPKQLRLMRETFTKLGGPDWKRAAVELEQGRRRGARPHAFGWVKQDRWWEEPIDGG